MNSKANEIKKKGSKGIEDRVEDWKKIARFS